jgi:hypothetical protein
MRFHWLRDRIRQGQFTITHLAGKLNLADFFTKTLPCAIHQDLMPRLVHSPLQASVSSAHGQWLTVTWSPSHRCYISFFFPIQYHNMY